MTKNKIYDLLIIILFYIGISAIPYSLVIPSKIFVLMCQIVSQLLIFFLIKLVLKKSSLKIVKKEDSNKTNMIWFIPVFIVCFSNFFCLLNPLNSIVFSFSVELLLDILLSFFIAFNEEYIFRVIVIDNLETQEKQFTKVIISASVFAACHLTHFFSSFNPIDLIIVVYTFGIGIILGLMYVTTGSFWFCVLFHFLFNAINSNLTSWIRFDSNMLSYYLINIAVGAIAAIYLLLTYLFVFKKQEKN